MRRRNITLRGQNIIETRRNFKEMKETLRQKFLEDEEALDKMLKHLLQSGFDVDDLRSYVTQAENSHRPAVEAFLFNSEHVIDQLFLTQGTYTGFRDTARDPNYALRHKGQTELILRRITPGDLLLLQCAQIHNVQDSGRRPAVDQPNYWQDLWLEIIFRVVPSRHRDKLRWLFEDYDAAAAAVMTFAKNSMKYEEASDAHLFEAFLDPTSPFYCGMILTWETRRTEDNFVRGWYIDRVENGNESKCMFCCVLAAYAIDNYARATLDGQRDLPVTDSFYTIFTRYLVEMQKVPSYFTTRQNHDDQQTEEPPSGNCESPSTF